VSGIRVRSQVGCADGSPVHRLLRIASGLLLTTALVAAPGWIALHGRDAPAPDDRDLRLAPTPEGAANGFEQLEAAAREARLPRDEPTWRRFQAFRSGETWEPDWIADLVAQNAPATVLLRASLATPAFAFPAFDGPRGGDDHLATLFRLQQLVALAGAQARLSLRAGRTREGIELGSLGLHVGKRVSSAENVDLFGISMAGAFQTVSLLDLEHAARSTKLSPETARGLGELLEATRWHGEDWQRVWSLEYERLLAAIDAASARSEEWAAFPGPASLLPRAYRWHPHRTAAALADLYRDQREKSATFCAEAHLRANDAPLLRPPSWWSLLSPNAMGRFVIAEVRSRGFDRIQLRRCQLETQVSLLEVLIAAKAYADAEGGLPERLSDLVPRYLDALPLDRFDGGPLRYARGVPAVYSVGEDFRDDDGGVGSSLLDPGAPGVSLRF
jgi:hypothetical protein